MLSYAAPYVQCLYKLVLYWTENDSMDQQQTEGITELKTVRISLTESWAVQMVIRSLTVVHISLEKK